MFAQSLTDDEAMEIATIYPKYAVGKQYKANNMFVHGENGVVDPQIYRVIQDHVSQADWPPDKTPSLYYKIGIDENGYPVWSQPSGAHDAYSKGDVIDYNGVIFESLIDGNVHSPDVNPSGWKRRE